MWFTEIRIANWFLCFPKLREQIFITSFFFLSFCLLALSGLRAFVTRRRVTPAQKEMQLRWEKYLRRLKKINEVSHNDDFSRKLNKTSWFILLQTDEGWAPFILQQQLWCCAATSAPGEVRGVEDFMVIASPHKVDVPLGGRRLTLGGVTSVLSMSDACLRPVAPLLASPRRVVLGLISFLSQLNLVMLDNEGWALLFFLAEKSAYSLPYSNGPRDPRRIHNHFYEGFMDVSNILKLKHWSAFIPDISLTEYLMALLNSEVPSSRCTSTALKICKRRAEKREKSSFLLGWKEMKRQVSFSALRVGWSKEKERRGATVKEKAERKKVGAVITTRLL